MIITDVDYRYIGDDYERILAKRKFRVRNIQGKWRKWYKQIGKYYCEIWYDGSKTLIKGNMYQAEMRAINREYHKMKKIRKRRKGPILKHGGKLADSL